MPSRPSLCRVAPAALAAALIALCLLAAPAAARGPEWAAAATQIGFQTWGQTPCGGNVPIVEAPLPADRDGEALINGAASGSCRITINVVSVGQLSWPDYCTLVVHEMGHVVGRHHVADAGDVMHFPAPAGWGPCQTPDPTTAAAAAAAAAVAVSSAAATSAAPPPSAAPAPAATPAAALAPAAKVKPAAKAKAARKAKRAKKKRKRARRVRPRR